MATNVIRVRGIFNGIYEWGQGFSNSEAARRWDLFWDRMEWTLNPCHWHFVRPHGPNTCGHLVSMAGSLYLHPLDFTAVLTDSEGRGLRRELLELDKICRAAAEACGGSFTMTTSEAVKVHFEKTIPWRGEAPQGRPSLRR